MLALCFRFLLPCCASPLTDQHQAPPDAGYGTTTPLPATLVHARNRPRLALPDDSGESRDSHRRSRPPSTSSIHSIDPTATLLHTAPPSPIGSIHWGVDEPRILAKLRKHAYLAIAAQRFDGKANRVFEIDGCLRSSAFLGCLRAGGVATPAVALLTAQSQIAQRQTPLNTQISQGMFVIGNAQVLSQHATLNAIDAFLPDMPLARMAYDETTQTVLDAEVARLTKGMMRHFPLGSVGATQPSLLNCFYVEGPWKKTFDPADTRVQDFAMLDGSVRSVSMMHLYAVNMLMTGNIDGFSVVCMKFLAHDRSGRALRMLYALPDERLDVRAQSAAFHALMRTLAGNADPSAVLRLRPAEIDFTVPRFALEASHAVTPYTGFMASNAGASADPPFIDIRQRVRVQHDEGGFRAAAVMRTREPHRRATPPAEYRVALNRPFYALLIADDGYPLLAMHVADPQPVATQWRVAPLAATGGFPDASLPPGPGQWWRR